MAKQSPHAHGPSEIWGRKASADAIDRVRDDLAERLRALRLELGMSQERAAERIGIHEKHLQRLETGANATVATLTAIAVAYGVALADLFVSAPVAVGPSPFEELPLDQAKPFQNCVPLLALEVAAGTFSETGNLHTSVEDALAWVRPNSRRRPRQGMFVAKVVGESMNRRVPNGAYCLFQSPVAGARAGRVLLVQHRDIQDPDLGANVTLKIWKSRKRRSGPDSWRHTEVELVPDSSDAAYRPIVLAPGPAQELKTVAELVQVLPENRKA